MRIERFVILILDDDLNETEETETISPDEMEVADCYGYITEKLSEVKNVKFIEFNQKRSEYENRNFSSTYLGTIYLNKEFGDISAEVCINCFSRAGYYEAACLDWECETEIDDNSSMNAGMLKIQQGNTEKWVEKTKDKLVELVEKVFAECSTSYRKLGTFSNGESIYEKI